MSAPAAIPLLDPRRGQRPLREALHAAFTRVLDSGQYILGAEVAALEADIAAACAAPHAVGVSSGSDALLVALMALGIGAGDEVICPTYTFFATAGCVWRTGARPVLVDCCPGCFNMLPDAAAAAYTPRTRALMPVHLFGQMAAMPALAAAAAAHGVPVIEDAAQALGARLDGRAAGTWGRFGAFSFFPSKNLGGFGDGGMLVMPDAADAERARVLRGHGAAPKYYHALVGGNFRLDALQAALLRVKAPTLAAQAAGRARHAAHYAARLPARGLAAPGRCLCASADGAADAPDAPIVLPVAARGEQIYNQFVVRLRGPGRRDQVRRHLQAAGIGCEVYYPVPLHQQACFAALGHPRGAFPHAEAAAAETLALPIFAELQDAEVERVCDAVLAASEVRVSSTQLPARRGA